MISLSSKLTSITTLAEFEQTFYSTNCEWHPNVFGGCDISTKFDGFTGRVGLGAVVAKFTSLAARNIEGIPQDIARLHEVGMNMRLLTSVATERMDLNQSLLFRIIRFVREWLSSKLGFESNEQAVKRVEESLCLGPLIAKHHRGLKQYRSNRADTQLAKYEQMDKFISGTLCELLRKWQSSEYWSICLTHCQNDIEAFVFLVQVMIGNQKISTRGYEAEAIFKHLPAGLTSEKIDSLKLDRDFAQLLKEIVALPPDVFRTR